MTDFHRIKRSVLLSLLFTLASSCIAHPLVQSGLESGEENNLLGLLLLGGPSLLSDADPGFRRMFVTAGTTTGEMNILGPGTPIENADAFCNLDSNNPDPGSLFKAMLHVGASSGRRGPCSTPNCSGGASEHVDWVMTPDTEYRRSDGTTIIGKTNLNAGIFPVDSTGLAISFSGSSGDYWSGMNSNWTLAIFNCGLWIQGSGSDGIFGDPTATNTDAIAVGFNDCGGPLHLLCVEQ
ncbi:MAG: hypothetical protein CMF59_07985 [Leptospiraceae bacterium]|nr:hypothetical protein [Leptospiraceae bacterium]